MESLLRGFWLACITNVSIPTGDRDGQRRPACLQPAIWRSGNDKQRSEWQPRAADLLPVFAWHSI